jgi:hypothetical protein
MGKENDMRCARAVFAGVLSLIISIPAATATAGQAADWKPSITLSAPKPAFKPYMVDWGARASADQKSTPKPTVVCGMTLVPADPKFDPQMRVTVPDRGAAYSMRAVPPTVCKAP